MCGIAGLLCLKHACTGEDHASLVEKMCSLQAHRGPDDVGVTSIGGLCLGAVRLSIIDLTAAGHMPMADQDGRWWIAYNGEVYNFDEIREELLRAGHTFRSKTDTEVVLHAFAEWGEHSLDRFVGMFAFAIYDRQTETLKLVRDRFGIKPLYYLQSDGHVFFSSEMKALLLVASRRHVNRQRLIEWSLYRNAEVLSPETLIEDINAVLPGHVVTIRGNGVSSWCYYSPPLQVDEERYQRFAEQSSGVVIDDFDAMLQQAVRALLVSDVPVGTLCSGGIDSSLITAVAARHHSQIAAFHISVAGYPQLDERGYAEQVTKALEIPLISYALDGKSFRKELPRAIYLGDNPLTHPNSVAFYLICQVARQHGVIVLLSGEGADELFGGYAWRYRRFKHLLRAQRFLRLMPRKLRKGLELAGYACNDMPSTSFLFDQLLPHTIAFIDCYARRDWYLRCEEAYTFVTKPFDRAILGAMLADLTDFLTPLLRRLDRMSMGASVECRVPFLDHRLVSHAINLPLPYRVGKRSDKYILKQLAQRYLPPSVAKRKKVGFPIPLQDYLAPLARSDLFDQGFCVEILGLRPRVMQEVITAWKPHTQAFFNLVSLEIWGRLFLRGESLESVGELLAKLESS
jgi:asparagine synthase (glutamine-hydrolysing)